MKPHRNIDQSEIDASLPERTAGRSRPGRRFAFLRFRLAAGHVLPRSRNGLWISGGAGFLVAALHLDRAPARFVVARTASPASLFISSSSRYGEPPLKLSRSRRLSIQVWRQAPG